MRFKLRAHGKAEWPRQGPPPYLMRETISGRRPVDGADTPGGVFRPGGVLTCLTKLLNAVTCA